jgi:hypothetical protein
MVSVQLEGMWDAPAEMHGRALKFNRRHSVTTCWRDYRVVVRIGIGQTWNDAWKHA